MKPSRTLASILATCLIALPMLAVNLHAQMYTGDTVWNPAGNPTQPSDGLWNDAANWTLGAVPGSTIIAHFNVSGAVPAVITDAENPGHVVIGDGGPGSVILTNGGSLTIAQPDWFAVGYSGAGYFEVDSGGTFSTPDIFWIGVVAGGSGTFVMNGGTVTVGNMFGMDFYGNGTGPNIANINGGTLNLHAWNPTQSIRGNSVLNVAGGTVIITGDHTATGDGSVPTLIAANQIVAYGGTGTVNVDYGNINPGATTITGTPSGVVGSSSQITYFAVAGGQVTVFYSTTPGATYHIESTASLSPPSWSTVAGSPTNNVSSSSVTFTCPVPGTRQYYRVVSP